MPSVSNIAIGANMAAAAGTKARHGMNESIARLSTGIRAMYGGDSAGHSVGTTHNAQAKSLCCCHKKYRRWYFICSNR